jgi:lipopolysaccharide transport system permease protein
LLLIPRSAATSFMIELFRDSYRYWELIWALALKELKIRYKRSVLGFMWALLNPALLMLVLTVVFSTIMRFNIPNYAIFLLSVLLPWTFFSQSLSYSVEAIVGNGDLIKKVAVPKLVFPMAALVSNIINLLLSLIPLAILVLLMRHPFYWTWLYLPVPVLALAIFTLGVSFFFAVANVFYRDVAHILQIVLSAWFYLTPIIYPLDLIPQKYRWFFKLNPIIYVINGFRLSVYYGQLPHLQSIVASFVCAFLSLFIGYSLFRRYQDSFVFYV